MQNNIEYAAMVNEFLYYKTIFPESFIRFDKNNYTNEEKEIILIDFINAYPDYDFKFSIEMSAIFYKRVK